MQQQHHYQQLIDLFDSCFAEEFNTRLRPMTTRPITVSCLRTVFLPAPCMRFLTGVSPAKRAANESILATGTALMAAMR